MEGIEHCTFNGKDGYRFGKHGKCFTYNKNKKSKLKAYYLASQEMCKVEFEKDK